MKNNTEQVRYLAESVPDIRNASNQRRKVLLTLLYWKVFDGIDIPADVMKQILARGTNPETITRELRRVSRLLNKKVGENRDNSSSEGVSSQFDKA